MQTSAVTVPVLPFQGVLLESFVSALRTATATSQKDSSANEEKPSPTKLTTPMREMSSK